MGGSTVQVAGRRLCVAVGWLVALTAIVWLSVSIVQAMMVYQQVDQKAQRVDRELAEARRELRQVQLRREMVDTPEGRELELRRKGYVRPGERFFQFETPLPTAPAEELVIPAESEKDADSPAATSAR